MSGFKLVFYGEGKRQMLLAGFPKLLFCRLREKGVQLLLIPISDEWEINSVYSVHTDPYELTDIHGIFRKEMFSMTVAELREKSIASST
ncbi:MAG: hypothetical protein FWG42_10435 [Clostridiales bacterium]|nr:hypothetical protein [Clostridiales bacterium]